MPVFLLGRFPGWTYSVSSTGLIERLWYHFERRGIVVRLVRLGGGDGRGTLEPCDGKIEAEKLEGIDRHRTPRCW